MNYTLLDSMSETEFDSTISTMSQEDLLVLAEYYVGKLESIIFQWFPLK